MLPSVPYKETISKQLMKRLVTKELTKQWSKIMAELFKIAYWEGMAKDVGYYYNQYCTTYQITKAPANQPAPLQSNVASQPWEILAVDILKFPCPAEVTSIYVLVMQDYFFKVALCNPTIGSEGRKNLTSTEGPNFTLRGALGLSLLCFSHCLLCF